MNDLIKEIQSTILTKTGTLNSILIYKSPKFINSPLYHKIIKATDFLNNKQDVSISERVYCILNNVTDITRCKCGTPVTYKKALKLGYSQYCSRQCIPTNPQLISKTKLINGQILKDKLFETKNQPLENSLSTVKKYITTRKLIQIFDKEIEQYLSIYQDVIKLTKFLPDQNGKGIGQSSISWAERFYCILNNITQYPQCPTCENNLYFLDSNKGYSSYCSNNCRIQTELVEKLSSLDDNFTILTHLNNFKSDIEYKCNICNSTYMRKLSNARWKTTFCSVCSGKNGSKPQFELYEWIDNDSKIINDRNQISPYELDIFISDSNLSIELNGNYWHSELNGKDYTYHLNKTRECEKKKIQLLNIFESEWKFKQNIIKSIINSKLGKCDRIYARKCKIKEITNNEKNKFLNQTHLQGEDKSSIRLGLYYNNELISVMTFCKSRFNKKYEWELSRFASELNTTVVGGASKLLSYFIKQYTPKSIISYSNRRYSNGNLYKQLGFQFLHNSKPNYFYLEKDHMDLLSRQQFQKHKLKDKLSIFYPELSEWENMKLNGYDRIWDCGNGVWGLECNPVQ